MTDLVQQPQIDMERGRFMQSNSVLNTETQKVDMMRVNTPGFNTGPVSSPAMRFSPLKMPPTSQDQATKQLKRNQGSQQKHESQGISFETNQELVAMKIGQNGENKLINSIEKVIS